MATILENNNQSSIGAQECAESSRNANTMPMRTFSEVKGLLFVREHQHRLASKREAKLHRQMQKACKQDLPKLAKYALKHGLNPLNQIFDKKRFTLSGKVKTNVSKGYIHMAASSGCIEVVKILLNARVPVDTLDSDKTTALQEAVTYNQPHIVKHLIKRGANVNVFNVHGVSALQQACVGSITKKSPSIAIFKILLDAGADVHYKFKNPRGNQTVTIKEFTVLSQAHALAKDRAAFDIVIAMLEKAMAFQVTEDAIEIPAAELYCSICHDVSEQKDWCHVACCNSQFHVGCMTHWLECSIHKDCPLCRGQTRNARKVVPI